MARSHRRRDDHPVHLERHQQPARSQTGVRGRQRSRPRTHVEPDYLTACIASPWTRASARSSSRRQASSMPTSPPSLTRRSEQRRSSKVMVARPHIVSFLDSTALGRARAQRSRARETRGAETRDRPAARTLRDGSSRSRPSTSALPVSAVAVERGDCARESRALGEILGHAHDRPATVLSASTSSSSTIARMIAIPIPPSTGSASAFGSASRSSLDHREREPGAGVRDDHLEAVVVDHEGDLHRAVTVARRRGARRCRRPP